MSMIPNLAPEWAWPDRTRRAYDVIRTHQLAAGKDITGMWVAIRLSDGTSDGQLYPTKMSATSHQLHEQQCAYICLPPWAEITIGELHTYIQTCERIYESGGRLSDVGAHIHPSALRY